MKVVFQQVPALREPRVAVQAATLDEHVAQTMRAVSRVVAAAPLTLVACTWYTVNFVVMYVIAWGIALLVNHHVVTLVNRKLQERR